MWIIFFLACTFLVFLLPIVPAIYELFYKTDVDALGIEKKYRGNVGHFADSFRTRIQEKMKMAIDKSGQIHFFEMSRPTRENIQEALKNKRTILSFKHTESRLPEQLLLNREIYASGNLYVGEKSNLRAILAEGDIILGPQTSISRWIDAQTIHAEKNCTLYGRASAHKHIQLNEGSSFERLNAPSISFGKKLIPDQPTDSNKTDESKPGQPSLPHTCLPKSHRHHPEAKRDTFRQDLYLDRALCHEGNLVIHGTANLPENSELKGSIKTSGALILRSNCKINGHLVAQKKIEIGSNSQVFGNVISEKSIWIARGCIIGSIDSQVSVVAPKIIIESGVIIHGSLSAYENGYIVDN